VREYTIGDRGAAVGEPVQGYRGLLLAAPRAVRLTSD
jgi:hypothetical protein